MEMAGAARGAVSSLLGSLSSVLVDEVKQLCGVRRELQSIKDEMESMNSFLLDLEEVHRPSHQQRTWMRQVRDLAYTAEHCISLQQALILQEGPPAKGLLGYLPPVRTLHARRKLAKEVRELNERIKRVNERRQRYGVQVPGKPSGPEATLASSQAAGGGDAGTIPGDDERTPKVEALRALTFSEPRILEECTQELVSWLSHTEEIASWHINQEDRFPAIAIAAPDKEDGADVAHEALAHPSVAAKFEHKFWIKVNLEWFTPPSPSYILDSILRELLCGREQEPEPQEDNLELQKAKIREHLHGQMSLIVLDGLDYVYKWEETIKAISDLGCATGSAVIVTTNRTQGSEQFCNPTRTPIIYSLVHFYYWKVLNLTSHVENKNYSAYIFRDILKRCEPHEFCMKIFAHALYASPNRSKKDLEKLSDSLVFMGPLDTNANKMLKFSYDDLDRDYKTCFLYLAIFPQGHKIKRSTLVGHWIAEGLIAKENWTHSVHRAERCFDELVDRWLVYPRDIGAAGEVRSCTVDALVTDFIAKTARRENFMDTGLSHHLTQHSIYNALRPEGIMVSSKSHPISYICQGCIGEFCTFCIKKKKQKNQLKPSGLPDVLAQTARSIELQMLKVLDFEGYQTLEHHQVLKHILKKIFLLRYLSLRNTDVTKLPKKIGKLQLLEILDIRQTKVHPTSTKHIVLPKLKRLLAGPSDQSASSTDTEKSFSTVKIPHRIKKMANLEVLSHVEASQSGAELKDIRMLRQLRKLGVVIYDKEDHIKNLLEAISDLHECLKSLSIRIEPGQPSHSNTDISFENPPKLLESLSISGLTSGRLLPLLAKSGDQLTKVTLHDTLLNQNDLEDLAELPKLRCVRLQHKSYIASKLTFKNDEFKNLKNLLVEGSNMTEINFEDEAAPELKNIVLSFANIISIIFGDEAAPKLEKIVLSSTNITGITFKNGAAPNLEEIVLSSTNTTNITFENGATPNLKKIVLSFTNMEFLSGIYYLPALKELELNDSRIASALLSLFTNANQLVKVTLRDTMLKQGDLQILAKQPNLRFLMLLDKSCDERQLTFNKEEFRNLKLLVVECFSITKISFAEGAAPKLEKIVWSFTDIQSLSGIDNLPALKELELKGDKIPNRVREAIAEHPNYPDLIHTQQKNQDKEEE